MKLNRSSFAGVLFAGALALLGPLSVAPEARATAAEARELDASAGQERTARLVGELLSQYHYSEQPIADELANKALDAYLNLLDPERSYFLARDVAAFERYRTELDNRLREGDVDPAFEIYRRFEQRVRERADYAVKLLDGDLSFDSDEQLELDRRKASWVESTAALDELWQRRVKNDALTLRLTGLEWDKVYETLRNRYERIARTTAQTSTSDVFELYMMAWGQGFDPHSAYMSPRSSENFDIHMRLSLEGIGALLKSSNDFTEIVELIAGGPAAQSGALKPGDRIIGVGQGRDGEMVDVVGLRLQDVVDLIRGRKGSTVRLQILPTTDGGTATPKVVDLVRNEIKLEEQAAQSEVIDLPKGDRIGVISIPAFYSDFAAADAGRKDYRSTTRDVRRLIKELKRSGGVDGLVIDLRGNGGGALSEAVDLTGLFIDEGPVVQIRDSTGRLEVLHDQDGGVAYDGPLAVLVDRYSASASEIFAAAVQDYGRGVVVGETTFGKGTVQTLIPLDRFSLKSKEPAGRLKLTVAKFYRVNGASTQLRGVEPDLVLPSPANDEEYGERATDNPLPWDRIKAVDYQPEHRVNGLLPVLREHYQARNAEDAAFQALLDEYAQLRKLQGRTKVSLSEASRRQQREALSQQRLDALNRRRAAYDLPPLKDISSAEEDESTPDTLLRAAASVVGELARLRAQTSPTVTWLPAAQAGR